MVPGRVQLAASMGVPEGLNAAAVRLPGWHRVAAAVAARVRWVASVVQPVAPGVDSLMVPLVSRASRRPLLGAAARASGTSARPAARRAGVQAAPLLWAGAWWELARSCLGRNPAT